MLSKTLKDLRKRKDITQADLADILGITQQAVARWERDKSEPDIKTLKQLAEYFSVSTDYLLGSKTKDLRIFSDDEKQLVNGYRTLDNAKKQTLFNMLAFLISPQGANTGNIIQNNRNGNNLYSNNGNNIVMAQQGELDETWRGLKEVLDVNKIKNLRLERGWTQEDLRKLLNVQKAAISKYENGMMRLQMTVGS